LRALFRLAVAGEDFRRAGKDVAEGVVEAHAAHLPALRPVARFASPVPVTTKTDW
jgi:hypothetical protein